MTYALVAAGVVLTVLLAMAWPKSFDSAALCKTCWPDSFTIGEMPMKQVTRTGRCRRQFAIGTIGLSCFSVTALRPCATTHQPFQIAG